VANAPTEAVIKKIVASFLRSLLLNICGEVLMEFAKVGIKFNVFCCLSI
jgi:hypothetical protein